MLLFQLRQRVDSVANAFFLDQPRNGQHRKLIAGVRFAVWEGVEVDTNVQHGDFLGRTAKVGQAALPEVGNRQKQLALFKQFVVNIPPVVIDVAAHIGTVEDSEYFAGHVQDIAQAHNVTANLAEMAQVIFIRRQVAPLQCQRQKLRFVGVQALACGTYFEERDGPAQELADKKQRPFQRGTLATRRILRGEHCARQQAMLDNTGVRIAAFIGRTRDDIRHHAERTKRRYLFNNECL